VIRIHVDVDLYADVDLDVVVDLVADVVAFVDAHRGERGSRGPCVQDYDYD
jgi:hypothetical protein